MLGEVLGAGTRDVERVRRLAELVLRSPERATVSAATSGVPSVEPLSTSSTSSHARRSGGSTQGSDGASFFTRSTAVVPGLKPSGLVQGQTMS